MANMNTNETSRVTAPTAAPDAHVSAASSAPLTPHILVVDDERAIADLVVTLLADEGMRARACYSGEQALALFAEEEFNLVILDIMMPGIDGLETCRRLRAASEVPIIFLSARDEEVDKVVGLMMGADDYVTKPFKPREMVARVRARLRRAALDSDRATDCLTANGIEMNPAAHTAFLHGEPLSLTPKEYDLLVLLLRAAGQPVSAKDLFESVWNEPYAASSSNSVMVHIRHVRKKLAAIDSSQEFIVTVWGVGYRVPTGGVGR